MRSPSFMTVTRVMEADPPDWRKTLLHELAVRNRREVAPFARLVESCEFLEGFGSSFGRLETL